MSTPRHARPEPGTRTEFDQINAAPITLNGLPARVVGRTNRFATVCQTGNHAVQAEFSWEAAQRIAMSHGKFIA